MRAAANKVEQRKRERRERDARRGRLGAGRFDALAKQVADVIRLAFDAGAIGSLFGLEGPLRHEIRADLCLQGWNWADANQMARELMDDALRRVNAHRPTWYEGQLEWTIEAGSLIERTRCVRCHKPLPEGHRKFCDHICNAVYHNRVNKRINMTEQRVLASVARWI